MDIVSAGRSDQGRRKNNEDFIAFFEPTDPDELINYGCLFIVADGVGGAAKGERASQYAAQRILFDYFQPYDPDPDLDSSAPFLIEPLEYLYNILKQVNEEIHDYATQNDTRMATTVVAAVVREGFLYVANVGDSRAYLIRDGAATPINRDHSLVGEMMDHGEMTEAEAMASSIKNRLTRSLGGDPDVIVDGYPPVQLQIGDKILLCSDGLTRYALQEEIARMTETGTPEQIAERLIKFANDRGGADNVSTIVIAYKSALMLEQPTLRTSRPPNVDFETVTPSFQKPITRRENSIVTSIFQGLGKRKWQAIAITSLLIVTLVLIIAGMALYDSMVPGVTKTPTLSPVATTVTSPISSETLSPTPTETPSSIPTVAISTTSTIILETPTLVGTSIETQTNQPPSGYDSLCVYKVDSAIENSGVLSLIIENKFKQKYMGDVKYYHCRLNSEETQCVEEYFIENNRYILNGWWIIIPSIENQQICESYQGTWVQKQ